LAVVVVGVAIDEEEVVAVEDSVIVDSAFEVIMMKRIKQNV
jgi:hypothetical protein